MKHAKVNPFKQLVTLITPYIKSLFDVKNASLFGLLLFLLWQVGYDSCLRPGIEKMGSLEKVIQQSEKQKKNQENHKQLFGELSKEVSDLPVQLPAISDKQPKSLVAVTQSERVLKLAKGETRLGLLPNRIPGAVVQVVKLVSLGPPKDTTIGEVISDLKPVVAEVAAGGGAPPGPPGPPAAAPGPDDKAKTPSDKPGETGAPPEPPQPTAESVRKLDDKTVPLTRFDYQLVALGTYTGFADLINQLTLSPQLITLRNLKIKPAENQPVGVLELTLDVSLLMSVKP